MRATVDVEGTPFLESHWAKVTLDDFFHPFRDGGSDFLDVTSESLGNTTAGLTFPLALIAALFLVGLPVPPGSSSSCPLPSALASMHKKCVPIPDWDDPDKRKKMN